MRQMSFSLTTPQVRRREKFVTRRLGWTDLSVGERLQAIVQGQGLKKGEKVERLTVIVVEQVRREPLRRMLDEPKYGAREVELEGFAAHSSWGTPDGFVQNFCKHNGCTPETVVTRIQFDYQDEKESA